MRMCRHGTSPNERLNVPPSSDCAQRGAGRLPEAIRLRKLLCRPNVLEDGKARAFDPARDMTALQEAVDKLGAVDLLIIDPLVMVGRGDSHKNAETRRDLQPLADLCAKTRAAALGIHHLAKGTAGREPQERLIGSVAFAALARIVLIAAKLQVT